MNFEAISHLIKFLLSLELLLLTSCGFTNGVTTFGSTSFLKESNRRAILTRDRHFAGEPMDDYSMGDKAALQRELDKTRRY